MKVIDNKRKEALTGGSILPGGCCPFVVTGNDGDNPVVLVFVVALCSWFDAFVVWCTTTSLDEGRASVEVGWAARVCVCVRVRVRGGCPGASFWSFSRFSASVHVRVRVRWPSAWPRARCWG